MPEKAEKLPTSIAHGARNLPEVTVDSYNIELRGSDGLTGDHASRRAFEDILEGWRERLRRFDDDPFGDVKTEDLRKKKLEKVLSSGDAEAAGLVQGAIEDFARDLAEVVRRFSRLKAWRGTERLAMGGGFSTSRIGELAIGRAMVLLKADGTDLDLTPIRHDPDEAGLIGAIHLAPAWIFSGRDGIVAADLGGTNFRAGIVELDAKKHPDLSKARAWRVETWRHADDRPTRHKAVEHLIDMLRSLIAAAAKQKLELAPFIGIGCPGIIRADGTIASGAQNLPGNWADERFNLAQRLCDAIPDIAEEKTAVVMHNDAVVQGLSEIQRMRDVKHWGMLTVGTGLGNARFTNKASKKN